MHGVHLLMLGLCLLSTYLGVVSTFDGPKVAKALRPLGRITLPKPAYASLHARRLVLVVAVLDEVELLRDA